MTCLSINVLCVRTFSEVFFYERSTRLSSLISMRVATLHTTTVTVLLVCLVVGCSSRSPVDQILTPVYVDFGNLFVQESTIRLDNSVLLGSSWSLNVNSKGELLVLDTQSQGAYLFSPDGILVWTKVITDCNPEASFNFGAKASFLDDSRISVLINKGAIVLGRNGDCVQVITDGELATNTWGLCSHRDTVFAMPRYIGENTFIRAYSSDFSLIDQFPLPAPNFQKRASIMLTDPGFAMRCFNDDVWWVYSESFDAAPRLPSAGQTRFMPDFFVERTRDYPDLALMDMDIMHKAEAEATRMRGLFALDNETRMIVYDSIDPSNEGPGRGVVIVNHRDRFPAVSTWLEKFPEAVENGWLYILNDLGDEPTEEIINPAIVRYRFVPPSGE